MSGDNHNPCRGTAFSSQKGATVAMDAARETTSQPLGQPYVYVCDDGHFHFRLDNAEVSQ